MNEMTCTACGKQMKQIGPFAARKREGEDSQKWDGKVSSQCVESGCGNEGKIIESGSKEESYMERMQKICECGHAREVHGRGMSLVPPGSAIPKYTPDSECEIDGCDCASYTERNSADQDGTL